MQFWPAPGFVLSDEVMLACESCNQGCNWAGARLAEFRNRGAGLAEGWRLGPVVERVRRSPGEAETKGSSCNLGCAYGTPTRATQGAFLTSGARPASNGRGHILGRGRRDPRIPPIPGGAGSKGWGRAPSGRGLWNLRTPATWGRCAPTCAGFLPRSLPFKRCRRGGAAARVPR